MVTIEDEYDMRIHSDFAILDVKLGRKSLLKKLKETPDPTKIPITITGHIIGIWGRDDGESQEFEVHVEKVHIP